MSRFKAAQSKVNVIRGLNNFLLRDASLGNRKTNIENPGETDVTVCRILNRIEHRVGRINLLAFPFHPDVFDDEFCYLQNRHNTVRIQPFLN